MEKSGILLFHEAVEALPGRLEENFQILKRAAAKGHEESIWILDMVKGVEMDLCVLQEVFAKREEPLGWYLAGVFSSPGAKGERFDFWKKSAEGGCGWGQVKYARYFKNGGGGFAAKDEKVYVEWLKKAANQNNLLAMDWLGDWFRWDGADAEKAVSHYRSAAEHGWKSSMYPLAEMLGDGEGCTKDLRQAVFWSAKGNRTIFWEILGDIKQASRRGRRANFGGCNFCLLCYSLGWGLYWYQFDNKEWDKSSNGEEKPFEDRCLDYYCSCVELQQESVFTFLLCWNQTTGVKGPGQMIAQMVWAGREDNLLKTFWK
jgi:hypothetical protein